MDSTISKLGTVPFRIEYIPRYGVTIGLFWRTEIDEEGKSNEDVVGHVRVKNEEEKLLWNQMIVTLNGMLELKPEIKGLPAQRIEPVGYSES